MRLSTAQYNRLSKKVQPEVAIRNRQNRATGESFEQLLDHYHDELLSTKQATILRTNPKIHVTAPGRAVITGKAEVDYIAFLPNGQIIHFDAKSRQGKAFTIDKKSLHQRDWLRSMWEYGHIAGYLVQWTDYDQIRWHSIAGIDQRVRLEDGINVHNGHWLNVVSNPFVALTSSATSNN